MNWYAVHTKPHQEELADLTLQRLGVETFYPRLKEDRLIRRRRQTTIAALFPGYLFARFELQRQYRAVNFAQGVRKLVAFGEDLATVDEQIIASMKARLQDGCLTIPVPPLRPGQVVRIQEGPLHGWEAVFERSLSGGDRVVLLLRTLAQQSRVIVFRGQVAAA